MHAPVLFERKYRLRFSGRRRNYYFHHRFGGGGLREINGLEMQLGHANWLEVLGV
jgi:hypothetical protein